MSVNNSLVTDFNDINEGDKVVLSERNWGTRTLREATVTRKTKTRFTVTDDAGVEKTYRSTISPRGGLTVYGKSGAVAYTTMLYRATDEVKDWVYYEKTKRHVKNLRGEVAERIDNLKNAEFGAAAADGAKELAAAAKVLADMEAYVAANADKYLA